MEIYFLHFECVPNAFLSEALFKTKKYTFGCDKAV